MTLCQPPSFGTKDPDDNIVEKNFDVAPLLLRLGRPASDVAFVEILVTGPDSALIITEIAWSPTAQRVSFRWAGGTLGATYLLTCRVHFVGGVDQVDQSATVDIAQH